MAFTFLVRLTATVLALLCLALPAAAREEISSFESNTVLRVDGSVDVTEQIDVNAEGDQIRHGIYRDVFVVLTNPDGSKLRSSLGVVGVTLDGQPAAYSTEGITNSVRIKIGDADTVIDPGAHRYVIHYTMTRMARFFADHDELYWNATGNYWNFPIVRAAVTVTLPAGATISQVKAYTGRPGSLEQAATASTSGDNLAVFRSTRELAPGEGMSVVVGFPTGIVKPSASTGDWLSDHRDTLVPAFGALLVLVYNFLAWNAVGRDPKKGTIIPLFHPPESASPALAHWVHQMGWKQNGWTAFTASIFDLGVKGLVTVDNADKKLTVTTTGQQPATPLPAEEQTLYDYFDSQGKLTVDKSNGPALDKKRAAMIAAVAPPNKGKYFNTNFGYVLLGIALAAIVLWIMTWLDVLDAGWLLAAVVIGGVLGVLTLVFRNGGGGSPIGLIFGLIIAVIFGANAIGAIGKIAFAHIETNTPAIAAGSIVLITVVFALLMRAPTVAGRKLMDQIDGFIMYLNTAEKNRLNLVGEPPMTVKRFEAVLPFAIALGVEKPWSDKFNAALAANAVSDAQGGVYMPLWYSGTNFSSNNFSSNIAAISTGMSAAMMAAQPAQSSSSGFSSGGGGSGGGGGGGGGGGW